MDVSLCLYDPKSHELKWAGAHNPLWLIRNGELTEIKADKCSIGSRDGISPYTTHELPLKIGDTIYLFSDGYPDQFGGENTARSKKLTRKRLRDLLLSMQDLHLTDQRNRLDEFIEHYRGTMEQTDDILVLGMRVN